MFAARANLPAEMEVDEVGNGPEEMDHEETVIPRRDRPLKTIVAEEYRDVDPRYVCFSFLD